MAVKLVKKGIKMFKTYITFGQSHLHKIGLKVFDKDCVAVIKSADEKSGRELAFKYFGDKFFTTYFEEQFNMDNMIYFPRGLIEVE